MSVKSWLRRAHCWLALLGMLACFPYLNAQIGTDHISLRGEPPHFYEIRIDQEYEVGEGGIPNLRDFTGVLFEPVNDSGLFRLTMTTLDEGASVFRVREGDFFAENNIQAGEYDLLTVGAGDVDFSEPVFLAFRTPAMSFSSSIPFVKSTAYGWARLVFTSEIENGVGHLQILDHAMEYGGEGIVVGESASDPHEGMIPVSHFGETETLAPLLDGFVKWNAGDLDGDGDVDLILPHAEGGFQVWKQNVNFGFEVFVDGRITDDGFPEDPVDVDGDGDLDVWISEKDFYRDASPSVIWLNNGDGTFARSDVDLPVSQTVHFEDFDLDGDVDVVSVVPAGDHAGSVRFDVSIQAWLNDGSGNFSRSFSLPVMCFSPGFPIVSGDWNGDGLVDLFYGCSGSYKVLLNQGDGTFNRTADTFRSSPWLEAYVGYSLAVGDVDGDGDSDVLIPNTNFPSVLWLNDGEGVFELGQTSFGMGHHHAFLGDIDTDGDLDTLLHTGANFMQAPGPDGLQIFRNEGSGTFLKGNSFRGAGQFDSPRLLDLDSDGDLDIVIKDGGNLVAYYNTIEYIRPDVSSDGIQIPDEGLRQAIVEALGKRWAESISEEEMLELIFLDLSISKRGTGAAPISDFTGLEKATRLKSLDLTGGIEFDFETGSERQLPAFDANDFGFLSSLAQLTTLKLAFNGLMELELPANLDRMEILDVSSNALSELKIPSEWTQLKEIHLGFNQISQLHLPESMSFLERLSVPSNEIAALQIPNGLVNLKTLSVSDNNLQSITLPPDLLSLSVMYLSGNQIETLEVPEQVGTQSDFLFVAAGESVRSFKASERWQNALFADSAFIRADQLQIDDSGHVEFPVFANQGAIVVEKSTDLKNWKAIQRIPVRHPNARPVFRDPEVMAQGAGFYRVQLRQ